MKVRIFGDFAKKWWFLYLLIGAKLFRDSSTATTGSDILDIIIIILILTGALYFGFILSGGEKVIIDNKK